MKTGSSDFVSLTPNKFNVLRLFHGCLLFFFVVISNTCSFDESEEYGNTPGIALGFDDYSPDTWEQHFDLFDTYGAKVTFFVIAGSVSDFMLRAQNRGHEIGYHTVRHPHLPELSREEFFEQTVSRIEIFKNAGIALTSFAYPFGEYQSWMHDELLQYYKIVRGFGDIRYYTADAMKYGFIDSGSIDNISYRSELHFKNKIDTVLREAKHYRKIVTLTSHTISGNDWGITPERLEYVLKKAQEYGLTFYRYKDLQ